MIRASYVGALARIFRYLSDSITILPDAQGQNDAHGTCAAELPGICDVNLVSHTMGDATWPSTWSRGFCKRENPTQGAPVRTCLLYTSPSPRDVEESRMPSSA